MNSQTNVQTISVATLFVSSFIWLLGFYQPDLMAAAPVGFESIATGGLVAMISYLVPKEKLGG